MNEKTKHTYFKVELKDVYNHLREVRHYQDPRGLSGLCDVLKKEVYSVANQYIYHFEGHLVAHRHGSDDFDFSV